MSRKAGIDPPLDSSIDSPIDPGTRAALERVDSGQVVGLGTGRAAARFVRGLGARVREGLEIRGVPIRKGDSVGLFYPSANRDEEVFEDPFEFRIDRSPNPHLAFGIGEHFCLGSHVARLEMQVAYKHLLPRIEEIELAGPPERLRSSLVGGVKHLPIRYRLKR